MLTARNIFIANLAVCDILLCLFTIPLALFDIVTTPVYKKAILAWAKRQADFKFFVHFLPRLSENDHS